MKLVSIVGTRTDFVQVAILSKALRTRHTEVMIHTGQHYDHEMNDVFFKELNLPEPEINLGVGSRGLTPQTAEMLVKIEECLQREDPDAVIVRGDTSGTLAGSIAAKQALFPLVHIEAGCRSFDMTMPEEISRITSDHLADLCITTDDAIADQLRREGIRGLIRVAGDVMYDTYLDAVENLKGAAQPGWLPRVPFDLITIHRAENTDEEPRLRSLIAGFEGAPRPVVFPIHPRTKARLQHFGIRLPDSIIAVEPLGYLDMIVAERASTLILTDSGGVQREAYYSETPCVTLRDTTEWTNTVDAGWNRLVGASTEQIAYFLKHPPAKPAMRPALFGNGDATEKIIAALESDPFREVVARARDARRARRWSANA